MDWINFFEGLFLFIVLLGFADWVCLEGLFTSAIASRIRNGNKDQEDD